jgi:hypothetical protein
VPPFIRFSLGPDTNSVSLANRDLFNDDNSNKMYRIMSLANRIARMESY